jgi:hypothetical protein
MDIARIGISSEYFGNAIVVFIDILGYSKFIIDNWVDNDKKFNKPFYLLIK